MPALHSLPKNQEAKLYQNFIHENAVLQLNFKEDAHVSFTPTPPTTRRHAVSSKNTIDRIFCAKDSFNVTLLLPQISFGDNVYEMLFAIKVLFNFQLLK